MSMASNKQGRTLGYRVHFDQWPQWDVLVAQAIGSPHRGFVPDLGLTVEQLMISS